MDQITSRKPDAEPDEPLRRTEEMDDSSTQPKETEAEEAGKKKDDSGGTRRRRLVLFLGLALVVAAIGGAIWYFVFAKGTESTDDAFIDARIVRIVPQTAGLLETVGVDSNTVVSAGDTLATIDPAGPKADFASAQASLAQARTGVVSAQAQLKQAQAQVDQAESAHTAAQVQAENARRTADRLEGIAKQSGSTAVSKQQIDDAAAAARAAEADADKAQTAIEAAKAGVEAAQAGVEAAKAQQTAAEAGVASAQVVMDHLTITAPADGQVVQVNVDTGSYVSPGQEIMALVPTHVFVTANFKETQLADIRAGQPVDIEVDAYPDANLHGHVASIQRGAGQAFQLLPPQNATGNFVKVVQRVPVRIEFDDLDPSKYTLGPGMSVVPTVHTDTDQAGQ